MAYYVWSHSVIILFFRIYLFYFVEFLFQCDILVFLCFRYLVEIDVVTQYIAFVQEI